MYIIKASRVVGVLMIWVVVMTTLLSCNKATTLEKDIEHLHMDRLFAEMNQDIIALALIVQEEKEYFEKNDFSDDYEEFIQSLERDFFVLEQEFSQKHREVQAGITDLTTLYATQPSNKKVVSELDNYQVALGAVFNLLMKYHYTLLETKVITQQFSRSMDEFVDYLGLGNITSNEYNADLTVVMNKNGDLLNLEEATIFDKDQLTTSQDTNALILHIKAAKAEIEGLKTNNEVDVTVNKAIFDMFTLIEQSLLAYSEFSVLRESDPHIGKETNELNSSIYTNATDFTLELLEKIKERYGKNSLIHSIVLTK